MKTRVLFSVALLSLLLQPRLFGQLRRPAAEQGQLTVAGTNIVSLGDIPNDTRIPTEFRILNPGGTPVDLIRVIPTCSCIKGTISTNQLQPKGEALLTLYMDPSSVHGKFKRGLWLETSDPAQPRMAFAVEGVVHPLFEGAPTNAVLLSAAGIGASWTNRFTLTATRTNVFLRAPLVHSNDNLRVACTFTSNATEMASYDLTVVLTALAFGRHATAVRLPLSGGGNTLPVKIEFQTQTGVELSVAPSTILVQSAEKPISRRLMIRTDATKPDPALLTWAPQREGVSVTVKPSIGSQNFLVTVTISTNAAAGILKETEPTLTFQYPQHKPFAVSLSPSALRETAPRPSPVTMPSSLLLPTPPERQPATDPQTPPGKKRYRGIGAR